MERLKNLISILNAHLKLHNKYRIHYSKIKTTKSFKNNSVISFRIHIYIQYLRSEHKETILLLESTDDKQLMEDAYENLILNIAFSKANHTFECEHGELVRSFRDITQTF